LAVAAATDWHEGNRRFWEECFQRLDTLLDEFKTADARQP